MSMLSIWLKQFQVLYLYSIKSAQKKELIAKCQEQCKKACHVSDLEN